LNDTYAHDDKQESSIHDEQFEHYDLQESSDIDIQIIANQIMHHDDEEVKNVMENKKLRNLENEKLEGKQGDVKQSKGDTI